MADVPAGAFTLLLFHSPELAYEAAGHGIDLYVGGHTHGGQLRLPLYGAIVTASRHGKRFEAGHYRVNSTEMYVTRGVGMEGHGAPPLRFLAPPEVVFIELVAPPAGVSGGG